MTGVNKTLYIPLYGKALVSRKGILLHDPKAEEIWEKEGFPLKGKASSKWLAYYMAMRAAVMDRWTASQLEQHPGASVLHIGCGMDSRRERVAAQNCRWYDIDFPEVIREREKYYTETEHYHMVAADMRFSEWKKVIPAGEEAVVVMEGVSMYLPPEALARLLKALKEHFGTVLLLMDCYSAFAARASRYKNPINQVGVTQVYGLDAPKKLAEETGFAYVKEHSMTPTTMIRRLNTGERILFSNLYAGRTARSLYRLYEFKA